MYVGSDGTLVGVDDEGGEVTFVSLAIGVPYPIRPVRIKATGITVTFNAGHTFVVGDAVTVNGTGSLVINNNAALRQTGEKTNVGNIIVKRNSAPMVRLDYTAWSSPVNGQQLQSFSPITLSNRFYQYLYTGTTTPTA